MNVTLAKFNNRRYEVIIATNSPYVGLDSLEVHKFDSKKRAYGFIVENKLQVTNIQNV